MAGGCDGEVEEVVLALLAIGKLLHAGGDGSEVLLDLLVVALGAELLQALFLLQTHGGVVDLEDVDGILVLEAVLVHADDGLNAAVDASLSAGSSLLDTHLGQTGLDGLGHTAQLLDLLDVLPSLEVELLVSFST